GKGGFEYIAGVEISKLDDLPEKYRWVEVQPQHYAVFEHKGSLDMLPQTFQYIWKTWLPQSGYQAADAPEFERYSEDFNPKLNTGVLEIWLPLKP
ncbi:MAG: GyrI-like domain-containing protein, partial [Pseudomonas sp.]